MNLLRYSSLVLAQLFHLLQWTPNSQFSEYTIQTIIIVNYSFNTQSLEFLRLLPRFIKSELTYPWSCSLQSRWLRFSPRSLCSCVVSRRWCYICVCNRTGRGICCKIKTAIERCQKLSKHVCATHRCFAVHVQHSQPKLDSAQIVEEQRLRTVTN